MGFTIDVGKAGPSFSLKGVDGKLHSLKDYAEKKAVVVVFTCNHCPAAVTAEDRLIQLQKDYAGKGVQLVAINPTRTRGIRPTASTTWSAGGGEEVQLPLPARRDAGRGQGLWRPAHAARVPARPGAQGRLPRAH